MCSNIISDDMQELEKLNDMLLQNASSTVTDQSNTLISVDENWPDCGTSDICSPTFSMFDNHFTTNADISRLPSIDTFTQGWSPNQMPTNVDMDTFDPQDRVNMDAFNPDETVAFLTDILRRHRDHRLSTFDNVPRQLRVSGLQLVRMSKEEFVSCCAKVGGFLYEEVQKKIKDTTFIPPPPLSQVDDALCGYRHCKEDECSFDQYLRQYLDDRGPLVVDQSTAFTYDYANSSGIDSGIESGPTVNPEQPAGKENCRQLTTASYPTISAPSFLGLGLSDAQLSTSARTSSDGNSSMSGSDTTGMNEHPRRRHSNRGRHNRLLYEYLLETLKVEEAISVTELIHWEDSTEGIFRVLKPKELATGWGLTKGNENMTYPIMSRALRGYVKNGKMDYIKGTRRFKFGSRCPWREYYASLMKPHIASVAAISHRQEEAIPRSDPMQFE